MLYHRRPSQRRRIRLHHPCQTQVVMPQQRDTAGDESLVPMRALTLIYHEDFEPEITAIIRDKMMVARYTKVRDVIGARTDNLHSADIAPMGRNHMLIIVASEDVVHDVAQDLRALRQAKGHGLRGYITPVEGLI